MEKTQVIIGYSLIFVGLLIAMFIAGKRIQKLRPDVIKRVNKISFILAIVFGLLNYFLDKPVLMYLFGVSLICFFLFLNYKEKK